MNKYRCIFQMGLEYALEYRFDFLFSMISCIFPIIIQFFLWSAIYLQPGASIDNGYTYEQMILYTLTAGFVSKLVIGGFEYEINEDIKNGGLNKYLIRPVHYMRYYFFSFLGKKVPSAVILLSAVAITTGVAGIALKTAISPVHILFFLVSLVLALILNFCLMFCIAMYSFWVTDVSKLFGTISIVLVVLSGGVFPMDLFGNVVRTVSHILPFCYTTQFPTDILTGRLSQNAIVSGIAIQLLWIVLLVFIGSLLWKKGLKRFISAGG